MSADHRIVEPIDRREFDSELPAHNFPNATTATPVHYPPSTPNSPEDSIASLHEELKRRIAADPAAAAVIIDALWEHAPDLYDLVKRLAAFNPEMPCSALGLDVLIAAADVLVNKIQRAVQASGGSL